MPTPTPRFRSPDQDAVGKTTGGVLLLRIVHRNARDRARWIWTIRQPDCGHEYDIPGRQVRERERALHEGRECGCYICLRMHNARLLNNGPALPGEIDKRFVPMTAVEKLAHCGRWV